MLSSCEATCSASLVQVPHIDDPRTPRPAAGRSQPFGAAFPSSTALQIHYRQRHPPHWPTSSWTASTATRRNDQLPLRSSHVLSRSLWTCRADPCCVVFAPAWADLAGRSPLRQTRWVAPTRMRHKASAGWLRHEARQRTFVLSDSEPDPPVAPHRRTSCEAGRTGPSTAAEGASA